MKEIISSILEAEKNADEIVKQAQAKAREIAKTTDAKVADIRSQSQASSRAKRIANLKKAEHEAQKVYDAILEDGEKQSQALHNATYKKVPQVAKEITDGILN